LSYNSLATMATPRPNPAPSGRRQESVSGIRLATDWIGNAPDEKRTAVYLKPVIKPINSYPAASHTDVDGPAAALQAAFQVSMGTAGKRKLSNQQMYLSGLPDGSGADTPNRVNSLVLQKQGSDGTPGRYEEEEVFVHIDTNVPRQLWQQFQSALVITRYSTATHSWHTRKIASGRAFEHTSCYTHKMSMALNRGWFTPSFWGGVAEVNPWFSFCLVATSIKNGKMTISLTKPFPLISDRDVDPNEPYEKAYYNALLKDKPKISRGLGFRGWWQPKIPVRKRTAHEAHAQDQSMARSAIKRIKVEDTAGSEDDGADPRHHRLPTPQ